MNKMARCLGRPVTAILFSLTLLVSLPVLASAQAAYKSVVTSGFTYQGPKCAWGITNLSNDVAPLAMASVGTSDWTYGNYCDGTDYQSPPGYLALRQDVLMWYGGQWTVCNSGPYVYNSTTSHSVSTGFGWQGQGPCGNFVYYRSVTYVYTWVGAGLNWRGGAFMGNDWVIARV